VLKRGRFQDRITPTQRTELLELLRTGAERVEIEGSVQPCSDVKDHKFIETAVVGGVDLLVSGDDHLHEPAVFECLAAAEIEVIRPADFVRTLHQLKPVQTGNLFTDWKIEP